MKALVRRWRTRLKYWGLDRKGIFAKIYRDNLWKNAESVSGPGSTREVTTEMRPILQDIWRRYAIRSVVDAACGDFNWMREMDLEGLDYTGLDIVPELVEANQQAYATSNIRFRQADLVEDRLPAADLILCRDVFVHLPAEAISAALDNFRRSNARYLLATTFPTQANHDIHPGQWRPINLSAPPFDLGPPLESHPESADPNNPLHIKHLALWELKP
ncbi:MAG: class I SAM-dependent methyltransferase [Bacteroidota bacterium]